VQFNVPELRVGTLDSLLALSDDLVKVNNLVEAVAQKIQRQVIELASSETEVRVCVPYLMKVACSCERVSRFLSKQQQQHIRRLYISQISSLFFPAGLP
jgi:hypothetical protein